MIHVKTLQFVDFGNIENLLIDFTIGDLIVIKGANGAGKTTAIEGIWQILRQKFPKEPIKKGKTKGGMQMVLGDGTKIEYFAKAQDDGSVLQSLTVTNESGRPLGKAEQANYLKQLIGGQGGGFDLHKFLREIGTKPAREELGKLSIQCGADITAIEKAKAAYDGVFRDRTFAKNALDAQKARALPYDESKAEMDLLDAAALSAEKSAIEAHNAKFERGKERQTQNEQALNTINSNITTLEEQIKALQAKLQSQLDARGHASMACVDGKTWLQDPANAPKETTDIDTQLADLTKTNEAISEAKRMAREHAEASRLQAAWETCDRSVKAAEKAKTEAVAACKLPAGLSFTEDGEGLNYVNPDGIVMPLEKASEAQKIMIAVELQLSQMGDLALFTANCSALDPLMLKELGDMLRSKGIDGGLEVRANTLAEMGLHVQLLEEHLGTAPAAPKTTLFE
jgi:predicted ATPase